MRTQHSKQQDTVFSSLRDLDCTGTFSSPNLPICALGGDGFPPRGARACLPVVAPWLPVRAAFEHAQVLTAGGIAGSRCAEKGAHHSLPAAAVGGRDAGVVVPGSPGAPRSPARDGDLPAHPPSPPLAVGGGGDCWSPPAVLWGAFSPLPPPRVPEAEPLSQHWLPADVAETFPGPLACQSTVFVR